jgi:GntR family transcriptional regulator, transcriptional repressor for pyruvate dehydrogenase complex
LGAWYRVYSLYQFCPSTAIDLTHTGNNLAVLNIKPIRKHQRLSDGVLDQLKDLLRQQSLKPGDKLPTERELSELFQVGRPSIREAIRSLFVFGFVDIRQGDGVYVKNPDLASYYKGIQESLDLLVTVKKRTLLEAFEVRKILEPQAAALAAKNADKSDVVKLQGLFAEMEDLQSDFEGYIDKDAEFHEAIARGSHNTVLHYMITLQYSLFRRLYLRSKLASGIFEIANPHHGLILEAIRNRSEKGAAKAMMDHLVHIESYISEIPEYGDN